MFLKAGGSPCPLGPPAEPCLGSSRKRRFGMALAWLVCSACPFSSSLDLSFQMLVSHMHQPCLFLLPHRPHAQRPPSQPTRSAVLTSPEALHTQQGGLRRCPGYLHLPTGLRPTAGRPAPSQPRVQGSRGFGDPGVSSAPPSNALPGRPFQNAQEFGCRAAEHILLAVAVEGPLGSHLLS